MTGWRGIPAKERRKVRRQNHIARDLRTPKFHMRRVESPDKNRNWKQELERQYPFDYEPE